MVKDDIKNDLEASAPELSLYEDSQVLQYISGYLIKKLHLVQCDDRNRDTGETFLFYVNNGGLKIPEADFQNKIEYLEVVFKKHIDDIKCTKDIISKLCHMASEVDLDLQIKELFFRIRMYARLRSWNRTIEEGRKKKKELLSNKYKKILTYLQFRFF